MPCFGEDSDLSPLFIRIKQYLCKCGSIVKYEHDNYAKQLVGSGTDIKKVRVHFKKTRWKALSFACFVYEVMATTTKQLLFFVRQLRQFGL